MLDRIIRALPLACYRPLRIAAARMPRSSLVRQGCVFVLQRAHHAHRNRLMERLSEVRPFDAPDLRFAPANSMVLETVYWYGIRGYEGMVPRVWRSFASRAQSILEIGGNVGIYTTIGARLSSGRYTVVEPVPEVASHLRKNIAINGITGVEILEAAAVPHERERDVLLNIPSEPNDVPVGSHLIEGTEVSDRSSSKTISVRGVPFRNLAEHRDLIKIDAEGIEAELLVSALDIIKKNKPTMIIEVLPDSENLARLLKDIAISCGYNLWALPEFGHDNPIALNFDQFDSSTPGRFNAKDVLLSTHLPD